MTYSNFYLIIRRRYVMKKKILAVLVCFCVMIGTGVSANAGTLIESFSCSLSKQYQKKIEVQVNSVLYGTYARGSTAIYSTFGFYQSAVLGNGETQVSPAGELNINVTSWCGFWTGYSTVAGNNIMAYMKVKNPYKTDTLTSFDWTY